MNTTQFRTSLFRRIRPGLLNSFSSVDHHAYSDNSVDPSRKQKITKTQKSIYTSHLIHNFTSILVYATVDVLPDFWMRLLLTNFSILGVVFDKAQCDQFLLL